MTLEIGKTYHQQFSNGDRVYVKILSQYKTGNYRAMGTNGRKAAKVYSVTPLVRWQETPQNEIPQNLH